MISLCFLLSCFHVLSRGVGKPSRKSRYDCVNSGCIYAEVQTSAYCFVHMALMIIQPLLSLVADRWVWVVCHQCPQHHPAAVRCAAQTQMTCMLTWPARCPLPAPIRPHQLTLARSEGLCGVDHHMDETRTGVSVGSRHTRHVGRLIHNSTTTQKSHTFSFNGMQIKFSTNANKINTW